MDRHYLITYETQPNICAAGDVAALSGVFQKSQFSGSSRTHTIIFPCSIRINLNVK